LLIIDFSLIFIIYARFSFSRFTTPSLMPPLDIYFLSLRRRHLSPSPSYSDFSRDRHLLLFFMPHAAYY